MTREQIQQFKKEKQGRELLTSCKLFENLRKQYTQTMEQMTAITRIEYLQKQNTLINYELSTFYRKNKKIDGDSPLRPGRTLAKEIIIS